jgi:GNAT superfamily N-acetyltransferase
MKTNLTIRDVVAGDYEQWKPLWDGYNAFYGREGPTALAPEVTYTTWERFLDPQEAMHALVAVEDGRILGLAHYLFHRSTLMAGQSCYLQDLFTVPEARGKGVGAALIDAACERAKAAGCPRLYWHTRETNTVARGLYDKVAQRSGAIVYHRLF